jgi:hypothetical protein
MAAIPKKGIVEYFGMIPEKLEVDFEKRTEEFLDNEIEDEFDYFEFIQHKCWHIANVAPSEIIKEIDQKLQRANWGNDKTANNWKTETTEVDNDAWILINENLNQIEEFTFRADLRQPQLRFLTEMVQLAKEKELLLIDRKGNLIEPEIENVIELIGKSNAGKFVNNPTNFLTDLAEGKIEIE